jgi:hypothetical protein
MRFKIKSLREETRIISLPSGTLFRYNGRIYLLTEDSVCNLCAVLLHNSKNSCYDSIESAEMVAEFREGLSTLVEPLGELVLEI